MFELAELATLANHMHATIAGKKIRQGSLGAVRHKFVSHNRTPGNN